MNNVFLAIYTELIKLAQEVENELPLLDLVDTMSALLLLDFAYAKLQWTSTATNLLSTPPLHKSPPIL